jgi:hypothetical protein
MKTKMLLLAALVGAAAMSANAGVRFGFSIGLPSCICRETSMVAFAWQTAKNNADKRKNNLITYIIRFLFRFGKGAWCREDSINSVCFSGSTQN